MLGRGLEMSLGRRGTERLVAGGTFGQWADLEPLGLGVAHDDGIVMAPAMGGVAVSFEPLYRTVALVKGTWRAQRRVTGPERARIIARMTYKTISRPSRDWYGTTDMASRENSLMK